MKLFQFNTTRKKGHVGPGSLIQVFQIFIYKPLGTVTAFFSMDDLNFHHFSGEPYIDNFYQIIWFWITSVWGDGQDKTDIDWSQW